MAKEKTVKSWISLILRAAMASLFVAAVVPKWKSGPDALLESFRTMFKGSWLPMPLVEFQARMIPYIETLIPIWLISGRRLKEAWIITALVLVSLAFGMLVVGQGAVAANSYLYVLICCAGLYFSPEDTMTLGVPGKKRK